MGMKPEAGGVQIVKSVLQHRRPWDHFPPYLQACIYFSYTPFIFTYFLIKTKKTNREKENQTKLFVKTIDDKTWPRRFFAGESLI